MSLYWMRRSQRRLVTKARGQAGITLGDLASRLGLDGGTVARVESGALLIDAKSRERVFNACGLWGEFGHGLLGGEIRLRPLAELDRRRREGMALARSRVTAAEPSPDPTWLASFAESLRSLGRPAEARPIIERAIARAETVEGADRCDLYRDLALTLRDLGELDQAQVAAERTLALGRAEHPDEPLRLAGHLLEYAYILRDRGDRAAAKAAARESAELEQQGSFHPIGQNLERDALLSEPDT